MPMPSTADIVAKWKTSMNNAAPAYKAGIQAVTDNPAAKAAAAVDKYRAGIQQSLDEGRYQRGLGRVTLQSWQQAALNVGATRFQSGVTKGESKVASFWQDFGPFLQNVTSQVRGMPSVTPEDREQRAIAQMRGTRQFRRTR